MGSLERVREWSHDRLGEPLEVEELLPDYIQVGRCILFSLFFAPRRSASLTSGPLSGRIDGFNHPVKKSGR